MRLNDQQRVIHKCCHPNFPIFWLLIPPLVTPVTPWKSPQISIFVTPFLPLWGDDIYGWPQRYLHRCSSNHQRYLKKKAFPFSFFDPFFNFFLFLTFLTYLKVHFFVTDSSILDTMSVINWNFLWKRRGQTFPNICSVLVCKVRMNTTCMFLGLHNILAVKKV